MMFSTRNRFLKSRYRKAIIFQGVSICAVLFCFIVLITFLVSIAKSAVMPLRSVEVLYTEELQNFIKNNLTNKELNYYVPRSVKYLIKSNKPQWTPIKYELKKYFLKGELADTALTEDYNKFLSFINQNNLIRSGFNWGFFTRSNSLYPEIAGIKSSVIGSLYVLAVFAILTIPIGILVGVYISDFLPYGKRKTAFQINIQNLASIPSIIYGVIVLNIFINTLGYTRSSALVGGIALSMLILPMIVMITYNACSMVPQGYKDSSLALGLSNVQTIFITTLPLAMPRIITGILLAIARAAGETAPLLMVGMAFFSTSTPESIFNSPTTTLPLQIFLWTNDPQEAFIEYASAAILAFIIILTFINLFVHFIRNKLNKI